MPGNSDKEILELLSNEITREQGFSMVVEKYSKRIYWTIRRMVVLHADADDILQETFIRFWSSLNSFRGESSIYTWLYRIAINSATNFLKQKNRYQTTDIETSDFFKNAIATDSLYDGDTIERSLEEAVSKLPTKQQIVFRLRYYDEVSYSDMAKILNTSEGSLKASYHIAAEKIEKEVKLSIIDFV